MIRTAFLVSVAVLLGACETMQPRVELAPAQPVRYAQPASAPAAPSGSLFQAASYRPGFEDPRARLPGDLVTIQIVERVTASQKSSSTTNRASGLDGSVGAFPFLKSTLLDKLSASAESSNTFKGDGATDTANTFTGNVTATTPDGKSRALRRGDADRLAAAHDQSRPDRRPTTAWAGGVATPTRSARPDAPVANCRRGLLLLSRRLTRLRLLALGVPVRQAA